MSKQSDAVEAICAEMVALGRADLRAEDLNARLKSLFQRLNRALGLSEEQVAEIERETEMQVTKEDEALFNSLPEDVASALRAIVEGDKARH
jgi:hypothetical protein